VLFCTQYQASAHLWLALHAHRRVDAEQSAMIAHHSEQACKILKSVILTGKKSSPKQVIATKKSALGPPARQRPIRKAIPAREPVTPKPKARKGNGCCCDVQFVSDLSFLCCSAATYVIECGDASSTE
jgi:separase